MMIIRHLPALALLAGLASAPSAADEGIAFFESKIRPLLVENCYDCHSVEAGKQKGGLLLDSKWGWETGGDSGPAIVPGDVEKSPLIDAVRRTEVRMDAMPPKSVLPADQVALLEQWIAMGAPDPRPKVEAEGSLVEAFDLKKRHEEHWCWRPVDPPAIPEGVHPVDHLIGQRLTAAGLRPAEPADSRTLIRRLYFDLIGLPPSPEDLSAFTNQNPEVVISSLLASPHFGEKWARHWMDLVRYAETYGHEFDYPIHHAHEYRDYLIRAFNADVPYDQFVTEHIAGDLLPEPRRHPVEGFNESVIATGFWYFHDATHAPTDVLQDEADHQDNQIDVFGKAFQGLTIACARCHDHKFDAISTADYYALTGYLHGSTRTDYPLDPGGAHAKAAARAKELQARAESLLARPVDRFRPGAYFLAAAPLVRARAADPEADPWAGIVFDDFESGFDRWTVEGDAMGTAPHTGPIPAEKGNTGIRGKGYVSSWRGSDNRTGALISDPFVIEKTFINFLVGGGKHRTTAIELRVAGKVVLHASGKNNRVVEATTWEVAAWKGQTAEIRIIDQQKGSWGHIHVDHIVFSDSRADHSVQPMPDESAIATAAARAGLDPGKLRAWCKLLSATGTKLSQPEELLIEWLSDPATVEKRRPDLPGFAAARERYEDETRVFADFAGSSLPEGWSTTGPAFVPTGDHAQLRFDPQAPLSDPGMIDSGWFSRKHVGTLRSPTFEIGENQEIHIRLKGEAATARVVIDNYHMAPFNGLLFKGTYFKGKDVDTEGEFRWLRFSGNLSKYAGHRAFLEFTDAEGGFVTIDEIRFAHRPPPAQAPHPVLAALLPPGGSALETDEQLAAALDEAWKAGRSGVINWFARHQLASPGDLRPEIAPLFSEGLELARNLPPARFALTMTRGTPEPAQIYIRGSHNNRGTEVPNRYLEVFGAKEGNRLDLARQIVNAENPLTARVIVNRLWHHLFGRGLVPTVDDFGPMGQEPSHPELLDWLAADFMANGWSLKHTLGTIVGSATYQQASMPHPDLDPALLAAADPSNVLLHRMNVRRLPAEAIRDAILATTGTLDPKPFGAGVPTHRTPFMTGRGARGSGPLDGAGRRSVYLTIYRNFLNPFLLTFDMPGPFGPKGRRSVSNVPAQSLALMNDPFVVGQTRIWGEAVAREEAPVEARIARMTERALGREPHPEEMERLRAFLDRQKVAHGGKDAMAWADLAHVLVNRKDFVFLR